MVAAIWEKPPSASSVAPPKPALSFRQRLDLEEARGGRFGRSRRQQAAPAARAADTVTEQPAQKKEEDGSGSKAEADEDEERKMVGGPGA